MRIRPRIQVWIPSHALVKNAVVTVYAVGHGYMFRLDASWRGRLYVRVRSTNGRRVVTRPLAGIFAASPSSHSQAHAAGLLQAAGDFCIDTDHTDPELLDDPDFAFLCLAALAVQAKEPPSAAVITYAQAENIAEEVGYDCVAHIKRFQNLGGYVPIIAFKDSACKRTPEATGPSDGTPLVIATLTVPQPTGVPIGPSPKPAPTGSAPTPAPTTPTSPTPLSGASISLAWSSAYPSWVSMTLSGFAPGEYNYTCNFASGGDATYPVTITGDPETVDNGATCFDTESGDFVWVTIDSVSSNTLQVGSSTAPPPPPEGFVIEDDIYGGTWARTDPNDGTWYPKSTPPPNGAYWYPNGLGVAVSCAESAAPYTAVIYGQAETWTWWAHVTDGKWVPTVVFSTVWSDGLPQGLSEC